MVLESSNCSPGQAGRAVPLMSQTDLECSPGFDPHNAPVMCDTERVINFPKPQFLQSKAGCVLSVFVADYGNRFQECCDHTRCDSFSVSRLHPTPGGWPRLSCTTVSIGVDWVLKMPSYSILCCIAAHLVLTLTTS